MADLKVMGKETLCGHEYENIEVYGAINAQNPFKCTRLEVYGFAKLQDDCVCDGKIDVYGSLKCSRDVRSDELSIAGIFKTDGGLNARNAEIMGKCTVGTGIGAANIDVCGSLSANERIEISGKLDVPGIVVCKSLKAHSADITGNVTVHSDTECDRLDILGKLMCKRLKATTINISGRVNTDGDVECEAIEIHGVAQISGLLNAESINIESASASRITSIGCGEISVKAKENCFFIEGDYIGLEKTHTKMVSYFAESPHTPILTADLIEGDYIVLEKTHAKMVRGKNVRIMRDCKIGVLEYTESYECDPSSSIGELKN